MPKKPKPPKLTAEQATSKLDDIYARQVKLMKQSLGLITHLEKTGDSSNYTEMKQDLLDFITKHDN